MPIVASRSHSLSGDVDREREETRQRLRASLAWAAGQGFNAKGEVGDPDALLAIEDELRRFGADELVVVTYPEDGAARSRTACSATWKKSWRFRSGRSRSIAR